MSSAFFVVLPSNSRSYEDNKPNKFKVRLPQKIIVDSNYVVGLHSIQYSNSWSAIGTTEEQFITVHLKDGRTEILKIPRGSYLTPNELSNNLHQGIIRELESEVAKRQKRPKRSVQHNIAPIDSEEILEENEEVEEEELPKYNTSSIEGRETEGRESQTVEVIGENVHLGYISVVKKYLHNLLQPLIRQEELLIKL